MPIRALLLTILGVLFLLMGFVGIFLPIWPTTPFVIAGAGCLSNAPRIRAKIMKIKFFREYIEHYQTRRGLSREVVIHSLGFLWFMLILSMLLTKLIWLIYLLAIVGVAVTIHILYLAKHKKG